MSNWRLLLAGAVLMALTGAGWQGYRMGAAHVQARWDKQIAELEAAHEREAGRREEAAAEVRVVYMDRVRTVEAEAKTIVKQVPVYVTAEHDRDCPIPNGFVRVHDAAARQDRLPADPGAAGTDGAASGVALSAVATTVAGNYGICHQYAERVKALQDFVQRMANRGES